MSDTAQIVMAVAGACLIVGLFDLADEIRYRRWWKRELERRRQGWHR